LPDLQRRLLRRLPLHPGTRITPHVAAALANTDLTEAHRALDVLVEQHLLTEANRHHYRLHDLLRGYAAYVLNRDEHIDERQAAARRLTVSTLAAVERATRLFHPHRHVNLMPDIATPYTPAVPHFSHPERAAAWLDREQESLRSLAVYWHEHDQPRAAAALAHMLAMYFDRRNLWNEGVPLHINALHSWSRYNHKRGQAHALTDLTTARWRLGELDEARFYGETALSLWRQLRDFEGEADALLQLGRVHRHARNLPEAAKDYRRSAALRSALHDEHGEAVSLYHLGIVLAETYDFDAAIASYEKALRLAQRNRDDAVERNALNNLGDCLQRLGEYERAIGYFSQALVIARRLGDPRNTAMITLNLGETHLLLGRPDAALSLLRPLLQTFAELADPQSEVNTLLALSDACAQTDTPQSASFLQRADRLAQELGDPNLLAKTQLVRAHHYAAAGDAATALAHYRDALSQGIRARSDLLEAQAHEGIGDMLVATHRSTSALPHWTKALTLYERLRNGRADTVRAELQTIDPAFPDKASK
jgi:tetratricopeptide (TPR) repeat protein